MNSGSIKNTINLHGSIVSLGARGYSNYEIAVQNGFEGSEQEWLDSLVGPVGPRGPIGPNNFHVGEEEPEDENVSVWLDTDEPIPNTFVPVATEETLGTIKPGNNLKVDKYGKLDVTIYGNSIEEMVNSKLKPQDVVRTLGYYEPNDGGGALYLIREKTENDVEDGGSIHFVGDSLVAELIIQDYIDVKQFGAKADGVSDDTLAIQRAIDYSYDNNINQIYVPYGTYNITKPLFLYDKLKIFGDNCNSSIIHKSTNNFSDDVNFKVDAIIILTNRERDITKNSYQQAIDNLQLTGYVNSYVDNKENKQHAIYSKKYAPKIKITNFLINCVDYGIYTPSMYTGLIQNCTYLEAHYGAIASYEESQGVNIANINTGATHEFGIKLSGAAYSTLSNILVEWNSGSTCFDLQYWRGNLINCGAELGTPGFNTAINLFQSRVTIYGAYLNADRNNENLVMFNLSRSTLKIENSSFGYSGDTNDYVGVFANISNKSSLIIGEGCSTPSKFRGGITRSGDDNTLTINDTKLSLTNSTMIPSIAGPTHRYEGNYIENLDSKIINQTIKSNGIYNGFISTPTNNNGANIEYAPSFNKGDIGIFDNPTINGCAMWLCNKNNHSNEEPETIGTITEISGNTIKMSDCNIVDNTKNGYRIFANCRIKGVNSGTEKTVSWVNYSTNTLNFSTTTDLDKFQVGEKLKIIPTDFVRNGDYLYIPIINAGYSNQRPSQNLIEGMMFSDLTLKKPIWYIGGKWVDSTGTQV